MNRSFDLAVVGANDLAGSAFVERLREQGFGGTLHALAAGETDAREVGEGDEALALRDARTFDFGEVAIAVFLADVADLELVQRAASAGAIAVDATGASADEPDVPLVVAGVNDAALAGLRERGIVALPARASVSLALALQPIHAAAGLERVDVTCLVPMAERGQAAVEELGRQAADLLNFREIEPRLLPAQIAFNLLPATGGPDGAGSALERAVRRELPALLGGDFTVVVSAVEIPVFFGQAQVVHLRTREPLGAARARALLAARPGLVIDDRPGCPSLVGEASGNTAVHVGRLREDPSDSRDLQLWIVADNVRSAAVENVARVVGIVAGDYL